MQPVSIFLTWLLVPVSYTVWTCDDLLGDTLCDLVVEESSVEVRGEKLFYWVYKKEGDNTGLPVVMVNGGPGLPHNYMLPLKQLACYGRKIIFYDQVGTEQSSILSLSQPQLNLNTTST